MLLNFANLPTEEEEVRRCSKHYKDRHMIINLGHAGQPQPGYAHHECTGEQKHNPRRGCHLWVKGNVEGILNHFIIKWEFTIFSTNIL